MTKRFTSHLLELIAVLRNPVFIKQLLWVGLLLVLMVFASLANIDYLQSNYPNPPRPPDRILDAIPQNIDFVQYGEYFSQIQIVLMFLIFVTSAERLRRMPKLGFLLFTMFILRAFTITLTPLAQITPPSEYFTESNVVAQRFYHGMFYSGHSASALIQAFFFWNSRFRGIRITWFILPTALAQIASLIIAHQHYSIDIFGAVFVVYFLLTFDFTKLVSGPRLANFAVRAGFLRKEDEAQSGRAGDDAPVM